MKNVDLAARPSAVARYIAGEGRRTSEARPRIRLSRRQIIDLSDCFDALAVFASFVAAQFLYAVVSGTPLSENGIYTLVGVLTALVFYVLVRSTRSATQQRRLRPFLSVLRAILVSFAFVIVFGYALKQAELHSRLWIGLSFAISVGLIGMKYLVLRRLRASGLIQGLVLERVALVGDNTLAESLKSSLEREHAGHHRISIYGLEHSQADLRRLITDALQDDYDRIIFCVPPSEVGNLRRLIDEIGFLPARLEICLAQTELQTLRKDFLGAPPHVLIDIGQRSRSEWAPMFKRAMDLGLGFVLLLATAPIIVLAAIAIKLDSRGPVFFRQRRHGWNHSIIWVWKLRSMTVLEDGNSVVQVGQNDKRVTRVGRFIRRTSIDELPQLFNVLSGEMSLVGPRPHALAHNVQYSDQIERYASRHIVKPGITGWAQIKDLRGNSEDISKMVARAEADLWYVQNWSIALDLWILLVTPFKLLSHKNAV